MENQFGKNLVGEEVNFLIVTLYLSFEIER